MTAAGMVAVVPVRDGTLPHGALEAIAEADGRAVLVGSQVAHVAVVARRHRTDLVEAGPYQPARWATLLAAHPSVTSATTVILPASPDGRDLAPRLAAALGRDLLAGATMVAAIAEDQVAITVARSGGRELHTFHVRQPCVTTLQPGVRGVDPREDGEPDRPGVDVAPAPSPAPAPSVRSDATTLDATVVAVVAPDASTMDLAEAERIIGGGAGLDGPERFDQLRIVGERLGAVVGATRVITDRGWIGHERQIGTTGVVVEPSLYLSFGVSGAVQHTSGLGDPAHVISVNIDEHCPMMQMSDLAVVGDANAVLDHLQRRLTDGAP
jgi:electron transfer flavoprotein alpha subunit